MSATSIMAEPIATFQRPQRWDASFDPDMTEAQVDRLLSLAPFKDMAHIFGVDAIGRDQLSLLLWGARSSLMLPSRRPSTTTT